MLKSVLPSILPMLFIFFNLCYFKGYDPQDWKAPKSILLNKPGKSNVIATNYRVIQLINVLGKTMESLIQSRMYEFSRNNNLINKEQAAYQWHKCTNDKIFQLTTTTTTTTS